MSDTGTTSAEAEKENAVASISFKEFLEKVHPSVKKPVADLWTTKNVSPSYRERVLGAPDLRLHCQICEGERTFRCAERASFSTNANQVTCHLRYRCGDCHEHVKFYSLWVEFHEKISGEVYKYGELPPFGVPVPNKVLRLFGKDAGIFLKGRQCENLGYGVGAFAYYRRVVENHKNDIFDEIIKVCRTVNAPEELVDELQDAKKEVSFTKAIDKIKSGLPHGLLINGHNPLLALHGALSVGLHDEGDDVCLEAAHAVRLVLTDLVEKIALLKQDNKQLNDAVQMLIKKKAPQVD
ncbi:hypothetical protein [Sinorhizobium meliloti]|uniref:hypothetical protein n=1 Tax=Rhizobium meliloti TaxID=382 RepID=UPI000FD7D1AB|nr:hypothetical protein [Sinorhizobium meliloti]RVE83324.1 hypothetical protein CN238_26710 [Sinorhizobium meliloti]RVH28572.1 hypothetical protein CN214_17775 [Sinorhizobium meliloti]